MLAAGASNSAKLLLTSANDKHPHGLANGSDQVGRNFMFHNSRAIMAVSLEKNPTVYQKTLGLNDFYFASQAYAFPMGNIQLVGKSLPAMYRGSRPRETALAPEFSLQQLSEHAVDFRLATEDLPLPENRVTLERDGTIRPAYRNTNTEESDRLYHELESLLNHLGTTATSISISRFRSPASDINPGPAVSERTRRPPCSTSTPKRTSSTISTWSIRASSRASARSIRR